MKRLFLFTLLASIQLCLAQEQSVHEEKSATGYIIISAIILTAVIVILYKRQKRKFNE